MNDSNLRFERPTVSVAEARELIVPWIRLTEEESIPLSRAFGRRIAHRVFAGHPVPHFRRSGVDGYAVRSDDIRGATPEHPVFLQVVEHIPSGSLPERCITPGTAARIMTGAPVPDEADTVVMLEMTDSLLGEGQTSQVAVKKALPPGRNVTPVAGEIAEGEKLLEEGDLIRAGEAAILSTFGYADVQVRRKPKVAIFSTGSELLNVEEKLMPGRIRNSNSYMLAAQVESAGGIANIMPVLSDDADIVQAAITDAFRNADLVITSGGVSVGDYDVLVHLFGRWDGKLLFNKVAMRPGSPTSAAVWQDRLLFALSGNPGASYVGFELFVRPVLLGMQGASRLTPEPRTAFLDSDYNKGSAHPRYVRGTTRAADGRLWVRPAGIDKSSIMVSIKDADCLILIPAGGSGTPQGGQVTIYPLE